MAVFTKINTNDISYIENQFKLGKIKIDLRDNPDNLPCGLNLTEATSRSGVMTGIFNSIDHTIPPNSGSFRCIDILLRKGCIVGIPEHPFRKCCCSIFC